MSDNGVLKTAFDIDGVLCKTWLLFETLFVERHGIKFNKKLRATYRYEHCGIPLDIVYDVISIALSPDSAYRIEPDLVALSYVESLYYKTGSTVPIITSRTDEAEIRFFLDNFLIKSRFPYILKYRDREIDKSCMLKPIQMRELGCVMLVEDSPEVAEVLYESALTALLVDREYNQECEYGLRFTDWRSAYNLILLVETMSHGGEFWAYSYR